VRLYYPRVWWTPRSRRRPSFGNILYLLPRLGLRTARRDSELRQPRRERSRGVALDGLLKEQAEKINSDGGKVADTHLRSGDPDKEILRAAEALGVGLIVMGSRGLGAISRMLIGSVSDSVVRHAHCPVFVVRK
jgi:nucleotide-binding universal stress UspA family protein